MAEEANDQTVGDGDDAGQPDDQRDDRRTFALRQSDGSEIEIERDALERVLSARLTKERQKYADYDELKQKASRLDEVEDAQRSELEKATKRAERAERERDDAKARITASLSRAAVVSAASRLGALDPDDAADLFLLRHADQVTVGDDGQVTGADDAVKAFLDSKPNLVGTAPRPGPSDGGPRSPAPSGDPASQHNDFVGQLLGRSP